MILDRFFYRFEVDFGGILGSFGGHFGGKIDEKRDIRILLVSETILKRNFMKMSLKK